MKRKQRIDGDMRSLAPLLGLEPSLQKDPFVDSFKIRQQKQKELQTAREDRFNRPSRIPVTMSYEQFLKARY
jgi:hypothetical protein